MSRALPPSVTTTESPAAPVETKAARARRLARERMRRRRERERRGARLLDIEVTPEFVSNLIDIGMLELSEIEDDKALRRAIVDMPARAVEEAKANGRNLRTADAPMTTRCARARLDRG